jgi:hypothetical protein
MARVMKKSEYHLVLSEDEAKAVLTSLNFSMDNIDISIVNDIARVRDELRRSLSPVLE